MIRKYLSEHDVRKLHLGAGSNELEGWLNTDIHPARPPMVYMNAVRAFPFPDQCFDYAFSEHLIEHLSYSQGIHMLAECYRVLRPGGEIRTATPGLDQLLKLFVEPMDASRERYLKWAAATFSEPVSIASACVGLNNAFLNWGHRFIYDKQTLSTMLLQAGFRGLKEFRPGESENKNLRGVDMRARDGNLREINEVETMVLEASKQGE